MWEIGPMVAGNRPPALAPREHATTKMVANVQNVICSAETMAQHPELYHYTPPAGFQGIVSSQTLWCSNFRKMVDKTELQLMRNRLPPAVAPRMDELVQGLNRKARRSWKAEGGGAKTARDLVNSLYGATFDGRAIYSALDAYLFSFSSHTADTAFDRENGIQSQWADYAPGGYCLVFDTAELAKMLLQESDGRYWAWLMLEPVRYDDRPVDELFPGLVNAAADTLRQFIFDQKIPEMAVEAFLTGVSLLKGSSYSSEREVRIVAMPGTKETAKRAALEYPGQFDPNTPLPEVGRRPDGKPYVALFEGMGLQLPIIRVIVGPGNRQEERAESARSLLTNVPVTMSLCGVSNCAGR